MEEPVTGLLSQVKALTQQAMQQQEAGAVRGLEAHTFLKLLGV